MFALLIIVAVLTSGCAGLPDRPPALQACREAFSASDRALAAAGMRDAGNARVTGFAYLRVNRFLASFRDQVAGAAAVADWVARMRALEVHDRRIELQNLYADPARARRQWRSLADCGRRLMAADLAHPRRIDALRRAARVPDDYSTTARVAGVYSLAVPFLKAGIARWQAQTLADFGHGGSQNGTAVRYAPGRAGAASPAQAADWLAAARTTDPLGIPDLPQAQLTALAKRYAPVWSVVTTGAYDRIGAPLRRGGGLVIADAAPEVYVKTGYTRFDGQVLLQLAYVAWFAQRPAQGWVDPLAGTLDGVIWRVTLDADGRPLAYDSIHPCGCYHLFFPTPRLIQRGGGGFWQAPVTVPATAPADGPMRLVVASGTHYLQGIVPADTDAGARHYALVPYAALRETRPLRLFAGDGLVPGSERSERWLLWPSGVRSAGAMRQWGHHATAFVGKRHFDDPFLIGRYFKRAGQ